MVAKNLLDNVLALPVDDRLELFEKLRENLLNDPELSALTAEEMQLLDERLAEFEADPTGGAPWEEVEARLAGLLKGRA
ncbi:MAG TPA: addiction module protein [Tepidisphaeraceae bacterium]|jgi:putative addiction module component (TIGR02574 family)